MTIETTAFDAAKFLGSDEAVAEFMADALDSGDAGYIAHALGVVARAKGMTQLAADTGLSRESLYKALSPTGNPTLSTLLSVMKAMNLRLDAHPISG